MNEKKLKKNNQTKEPARVRLLGGRRVEASLYLERTTSLPTAGALVKELAARRPVGMGAAVDAAFQRMVDTQPMVYATIAQGQEEDSTFLAEARNRLTGAVATVTGPLDTYVAADGGGEVGLAAHAVLRDTFGEKRADFARLGPREGWLMLDVVRQRMEASPDARARLETLVPAALVTKLLAAHDALGSTLRMTRESARETAVELDGRDVIRHVNQHIDHYVICVLATAVPGDEDAWARVQHTLQPIIDHRVRAARRRARKAAAEGEPEADDGGEVVVAPASPTPTPPTPTVATPTVAAPTVAAPTSPD